MKKIVLMILLGASGCATSVGPCSQIDYSLTLPSVPFFSEIAFTRQVTDDWCDLSPEERSSLNASSD